MVASVQCLTVRFRSSQAEQSTQRFRHNIGSAFAFTKNYLFTTHKLLQELDTDFEIDSVWISDPADPVTRLGCKVRVLGSIEELDVALLECDQIDLPDYDLCHTPPHNPLVIYVAHRGQSLTPEVRRGTAYPLRRPYEGLCCIRPMKRCSGSPVLDSHARVIGMLKSGVSFVTSDGLMHALKQIGMLLDDDGFAEIEDLCSLWEFNKAVVEEEHAVAQLLRKRHAELQGGGATKKAKKSLPSGEGHNIKRVHEHGMNEHPRPVNYSSILNLCAQIVLESVEAEHAKTMDRLDFSQHEPAALLNTHRLDHNNPAYLSQPAKKFPAYRSPVVIRSVQSLENTSGYTNYNSDQSPPNSPFNQSCSLKKCRDSQGFENSKQYFTDREPYVCSRADDIYSSARYSQGEKSLERENWIYNRTFNSPPGLQSLNVPRVQRRFSVGDNADFLLKFYPDDLQTPSGWNPPSVHEKWLESEAGELYSRYQSKTPQTPQQQTLESGSPGCNRPLPQTPGLSRGLEEARNQGRLRGSPQLRPLTSTLYSGSNVPSHYQQQQTQPTFTQPIYPNVPATARNWPLPSQYHVTQTSGPVDVYHREQYATSSPPLLPLPSLLSRITLPPLAPIMLNETKLTPNYQLPRPPSVPMQATYHNIKAIDSNVMSSAPYRSIVRKVRAVDEPQLRHRHRQDADKILPTHPNPDEDALPSRRGYVPPSPTSMNSFPGSPSSMKTPKAPAPRWRIRIRSRRPVYASKYQLLDNRAPRASATKKHQHEILLPSEDTSVAESDSEDGNMDPDPEAKGVGWDAEMTEDESPRLIYEHPADDASIADSGFEDEVVDLL